MTQEEQEIIDRGLTRLPGILGGSDADRPTPEQAKAALEAIQKRSRMTVPKLLARYQERVAEQTAIASGAKEQIDGLKIVVENAERKAAFWLEVIAEIERGEA